MTDLISFAHRLQEVVVLCKRQPHWEPAEAERYMTEVRVRRQLFAELVARLMTTVIRPRLDLLASYFPNASATRNEPKSQCSYWFGYCERFPATTKVTLAIEHNARVEKVIVAYETCMTPRFIKLNERDKLTLSIEEIKEEIVEHWVENRLLEFLDSYLQIDRGGDDLSDETVTDPVCGMRINRSAAVASDSYGGHPYFFCSSECQHVFRRDPKTYVVVEPM